MHATLVVVSFKFPLMAYAPPLGHGVARDRRGRGRDGGEDADGGVRETEPCAHGGSGYPRTQTSQLWPSQTVHSKDLAKRCSCAGNSFHLGSVNFRALYVVAKFNLSTPRRPPRSGRRPNVYVHMCCLALFVFAASCTASYRSLGIKACAITAHIQMKAEKR